MRVHLADVLPELSVDDMHELEQIVRHPAGERFEHVLVDHLRGSPELVKAITVTPRVASSAKTSAERAAEFRARRRANALSNPKEK